MHLLTDQLKLILQNSDRQSLSLTSITADGWNHQLFAHKGSFWSPWTEL